MATSHQQTFNSVASSSSGGEVAGCDRWQKKDHRCQRAAIQKRDGLIKSGSGRRRLSFGGVHGRVHGSTVHFKVHPNGSSHQHWWTSAPVVGFGSVGLGGPGCQRPEEVRLEVQERIGGSVLGRLEVPVCASTRCFWGTGLQKGTRSRKEGHSFHSRMVSQHECGWIPVPIHVQSQKPERSYIKPKGCRTLRTLRSSSTFTSNSIVFLLSLSNLKPAMPCLASSMIRSRQTYRLHECIDAFVPGHRPDWCSVCVCQPLSQRDLFLLSIFREPNPSGLYRKNSRGPMGTWMAWANYLHKFLTYSKELMSLFKHSVALTFHSCGFASQVLSVHLKG